MDRALRLKEIRAKYAKVPNQSVGAQNQSVTKPKEDGGVLNTLANILKFNTFRAMRNSNNLAVSEDKPVANANSPKSPANKPKPRSNNATAKRKQAMADRKQKRVESNNKRLYDKALEKGIVKDGSVDAIRLQDAIQSNYDAVKQMVESTMPANIKSAQNPDKELQDMKRKQLQKSGVQYVNLAQNNNVTI